MGSYALIKDGMVINTIAWEGPDVAPVDFGEGVEAVNIPDELLICAGYSYAKGKFTAPEPTEEELASQQEEQKAANSSLKDSLMAEATQTISILQDAVDLDMATDEESTSLPLWKKYRVLLSRIDASTPEEIKWPQRPS